MDNRYQLIIVGGGPAGLTAATYAGRSQIKTLVLADQLGGMISFAHKVQNFPGEQEITGQALAEKMISQAKKWGAELINTRVTKIEKQENLFSVETEKNEIYQAPFILLALGTQKRKLNLPNEESFLGRGLSYCPLCDGNFFKNKKVAVSGSGDAAATTAIFLSDIAQEVYLIARRAELKCNPSWQKITQEKQNISLICSQEIIELIGQDKLTALKLKDINNETSELPIDGLFVEIGVIPSSLIAQQLEIELTTEGFIKTNQAGQTSQPGIWAAGDITDGSNGLWQAVTACAEGAIAAEDIYQQIKLSN
jgi:thioredoxin reductase (NADPH)